MPDEATRTITLISLFRTTSRRMVDELIERLHAAGYSDMTAAHHPVFENIDPEGTRLTVLATRAGLSNQSAGELVEALERRGYVERRPDSTDGRARLVVLTRKGRTLVRQAISEINMLMLSVADQLISAGQLRPPPGLSSAWIASSTSLIPPWVLTSSRSRIVSVSANSFAARASDVVDWTDWPTMMIDRSTS